MIISQPDAAGYVQFTGSADILSAEAAGPSFVTGAAAHDGGDPVIRVAGWTAPTAAQPNWSRALELPALTSELEVVVDGCVVALRDVYQVSDPSVLTYRAWRDAEQ